MYPTIKDVNTVHSGTGVFYQAMPAVGADGKNIMKLIPVQMVNGQFVQTQTIKPISKPAPPRVKTTKTAPAAVHSVNKVDVNPSASQPAAMKQVSLLNHSPHQAGLNLNSLNKHPQQQQAVNLIARVPPMATQTAHCESGRLPAGQIPVTVKSPALPRGHYLLIPPNAQVQTVPASELPQNIKKQIFTSSSSASSADLGSPSVVCVSPITTVNQGITPPSDPALHSIKVPPKMLYKTSCGTPAKISKPHLTLIPKVSQRPNSPIKWMIEEETHSPASTFDSLNSSLTSEILLAMAKREKVSKTCNVITKPVSQVGQSSQGRSEGGQENALLMCNGKVFFVAKKCNLPLEPGQSDSPTAATNSSESNKSVVPSFLRTREPAARQTEQDLRIIIRDDPEEVIDLCDDDAQDDTSAVGRPDDDNVIFVSYIPPKCGSTQDLTQKGQMTVMKETGQSRATEEQSLNSKSCCVDRREISSALSLTHVSGSVKNMQENDSSVNNSQHQQSAAPAQVESVDVAEEGKSTTHPVTSDSCSGKEKNLHRTEESVKPTRRTCSPSPESRELSDPLLRQMFGITADVRICLQRIDEASAEPRQTESTGSDQGHLEPANQQHGKDRDVKVSTGQELSGPSACSHLKVNTKLSASKSNCHSGQSSLKETSHDTKNEPAIGYVEPIDEDFLSTDDKDISSSRDTADCPQSCVNMKTNTRRIGRKRKRTICPCCVPGAQGPAVKSAVKSVESESSETEQTSKKVVRTKAVKLSVTISC